MSSEESAIEAAPETSKKVEAPKVVVLQSYDGEEFEVDLVVASQSETIKNMIEDGCVERSVPLPNVEGSVLAKVVEYWKRHVEGGKEEELKKWDKEFVEAEKQEVLEIMVAAHYLNSQPLFDLCCQAVANTISDMTVEDVREYFGIENDLTPEEERRIKDVNRWVFD
ncbi:SKP1-like protein 12 [Elaeis guineensis]|uniref:SKP1-like protein n=1 Tax=Elaeis guineensis var. tenera TaxID=51953 RepID=A0A6I9S4R2_ELAGV|nr:SKP1-like protein 12 [Elaeis guineensis]XP_010933386.1 SKP1-like protein 12 [Elaeis guineensis]